MNEPNGTTAYRLSEVEKDVRELNARFDRRADSLDRKMDKVLWALVGLAISGFSLALAILLTSQLGATGG